MKFPYQIINQCLAVPPTIGLYSLLNIGLTCGERVKIGKKLLQIAQLSYIMESEFGG